MDKEKKKKVIRVKKYKRYKNGKWKDVTERFRKTDSEVLAKQIIDDLEKGFALELDAEDYDILTKKTEIKSISDIKVYWDLMNEDEKTGFITNIGDIDELDYEIERAYIKVNDFETIINDVYIPEPLIISRANEYIKKHFDNKNKVL